MDRKKFIKNGLIGMGAIIAAPVVISSCKKDDDNEDCSVAPNETAGPFPIKSPASLVLENIISDRKGIALLITLTIKDSDNNSEPLVNAFVDLWHCDAEGNYSQYGGTQMQSIDYTNKNFLRGRQQTDSNGKVSFITIFPGWYPSRSPHIHLEVLDSNKNSLKISQIAFAESVCNTVYATTEYNGSADTANDNDNVFSDSLDCNMADSITGNTIDGYILLKTIVI